MSQHRIAPKANQESVWDYPRPPRLEASSKLLRVVHKGIVIAETRNALRVLETSHPPNYYFPPQDVRMEFFRRAPLRTVCELKGTAGYWTLIIGDRITENAAWSYDRPQAGYEGLRGYIAFYASRVDECYADGERVKPQPGEFYGGWITSDVVGPFKGAPGTLGW